ncbi:unnamed protein product [Acanthosepion pharaonis]|uniref:Uncharacterized protein n=1 Tax=Acanthosepion pharaonis TaxID=158019 RepID=A0A812DYU9_ACAPH|nr:unnamed protein product [Sepia pharaonis]
MTPSWKTTIHGSFELSTFSVKLCPLNGNMSSNNSYLCLASLATLKKLASFSTFSGISRFLSFLFSFFRIVLTSFHIPFPSRFPSFLPSFLPSFFPSFLPLVPLRWFFYFFCYDNVISHSLLLFPSLSHNHPQLSPSSFFQDHLSKIWRFFFQSSFSLRFCIKKSFRNFLSFYFRRFFSFLCTSPSTRCSIFFSTLSWNFTPESSSPRTRLLYPRYQNF